MSFDCASWSSCRGQHRSLRRAIQAVAQPTTAAFTDLVRAPELTGETPSRHIPSQRSTPRNKRRAPSSFVWRARRAGIVLTAGSGALLALEIGALFLLGPTTIIPCRGNS